MNNWNRIKYNKGTNSLEGNALPPHDEYIFLLDESGKATINIVSDCEGEDYIEEGDIEEIETVIAWQPLISPDPLSNWNRIKYNKNTNRLEGAVLPPYDEYIFLLDEDEEIAIGVICHCGGDDDPEDYIGDGDIEEIETVVAWRPVIYPDPFIGN